MKYKIVFAVNTEAASLREGAPHHPLGASHRPPKGGILTRQQDYL